MKISFSFFIKNKKLCIIKKNIQNTQIILENKENENNFDKVMKKKYIL